MSQAEGHVRCAAVLVEFLSDDQAAAYERLLVSSRSELEGFFLLDRIALDLIATKRGEHNRLGVGLQIGTVRYLGHFLTENPSEVPWSEVAYAAGQSLRAAPAGAMMLTEIRGRLPALLRRQVSRKPLTAAELPLVPPMRRRAV